MSWLLALLAEFLIEVVPSGQELWVLTVGALVSVMMTLTGLTARIAFGVSDGFQRARNLCLGLADRS